MKDVARDILLIVLHSRAVGEVVDYGSFPRLGERSIYRRAKATLIAEVQRLMKRFFLN